MISDLSTKRTSSITVTSISRGRSTYKMAANKTAAIDMKRNYVTVAPCISSRLTDTLLVQVVSYVSTLLVLTLTAWMWWCCSQAADVLNDVVTQVRQVGLQPSDVARIMQYYTVWTHFSLSSTQILAFIQYFQYNLLTRPAGITSNFSSRVFSVSVASTWNSLPAHIRYR